MLWLPERETSIYYRSSNALSPQPNQNDTCIPGGSLEFRHNKVKRGEKKCFSKVGPRINKRKWVKGS